MKGALISLTSILSFYHILISCSFTVVAIEDSSSNDLDDSDGYNSQESDQFWNELPFERRESLETLGWNEHFWNSGDDPYFTQSWHEMGKTRQKALITLGWTKETWSMTKDDGYKTPIEAMPWNMLSKKQRKAASKLELNEEMWQHGNVLEWGMEFNPVVVNFSIPELEALDLDYLESLEDVEVEVMDGDTLGDDVFCQNRGLSMTDYIQSLKNGSKLYLKYEDYDPFKIALRDTVGSKVLTYLRDAIVNNSPLRDPMGYYKPEFDDAELDDSNWLIWVGGKNTSTSMHFDNDSFNFLWVMQGRKRVVMLPNNHLTAGKYGCITHLEGHSCWTGQDILNGPLPEHAVEVELGPGEGLMIPYLHWHAVQNLEATVAYGFRVDVDMASQEVKSWEKLTGTEKDSALYLGYNETAWDNKWFQAGSCSDGSCSDEEL